MLKALNTKLLRKVLRKTTLFRLFYENCFKMKRLKTPFSNPLFQLAYNELLFKKASSIQSVNSFHCLDSCKFTMVLSAYTIQLEHNSNVQK